MCTGASFDECEAAERRGEEVVDDLAISFVLSVARPPDGLHRAKLSATLEQ